MARRIGPSLSKRPLDLSRIALHHQDVENAVTGFFSSPRAWSNPRFFGMSDGEIQEQMRGIFEENDRQTTFNILCWLEGAFRLDYFHRINERKRNSVSTTMKDVYNRRGDKPRLRDDIFEAWKQHPEILHGYPGATMARIISELKGAFRYRDWFAHGRYWKPRLGRMYDYDTVLQLAELVSERFPLRTR